MSLNGFMADKLLPMPETPERDAFAELPTGRIPEGQRNSTMSRIAGCLVKRYGDTDESYSAFLEKAAACDPPLDDSELKTIWSSAVKFGKKVAAQEGYIPPDKFNDPTPLKPEDYSDVGQAQIFAKHCRNGVRYSPATDYIVYDGVCWLESKPKAQAALHEFTDGQLIEAEEKTYMFF